MTRRTKIAVAALSVTLLAGLLLGLVIRPYFARKLGDPGPELTHVSAVAAAAHTADNIDSAFQRDAMYKADEYAHTAAQFEGVEIMSLTGETHWQSGVELTVRIPGDGIEKGWDGYTIKTSHELICFHFHLGPDDDTRSDDVPCPPSAPLQIAKDPDLTGVDDRLKTALTNRLDESQVRAAVTALNLDPAIRQDFASADGTVGVALRAAQYECIIARVTGGKAETWRPSRIQLSPGELDCTAGIALSPTFGTTPH
ncbi:hypothetical protein GCM10010435_14430 [Winogradskya consettensis]|uniref:Uncharacterized protein n=1 Tax=Winogradskya consettensis TaxID=113560 RepID=A0A919VK64_9ACTN|nr:hypothetical protein [Actinoplanes consettensis]GIM69095.1 hypothetical protein Aco04nite_13700 [Actinoplanes consettensis]